MKQCTAQQIRMERHNPHVLVLTNAFPVGEEPNKGLDIKEQVRRLSSCFDIKVICAQSENVLRNKGRIAQICSRVNGIDVFQTKYYSLPKIGVFTNGYSYYRSHHKLIKSLHKSSPVDLIICYWTYPEGFAASLIAKKLNIPFIIRPRGSDINIYMKLSLLRVLIKYVLKRANKIVPVCNDLGISIKNLGISDDKIHCVPFGIDSRKFSLLEKKSCREKLKIDIEREVILFVGNLVEIKGIDYLLEAIKILERNGRHNILLNIVGSGKLDARFREKIKEIEYCKVVLRGEIANKDIPLWMNASDLFCLPSVSEGYPNVLMEALACGTPVVATNVGGIPEIINNASLGVLVPPRNPQALSQAIEAVLCRKWDRKLLINRARQNDWQRVTEEIVTICNALVK